MNAKNVFFGFLFLLVQTSSYCQQKNNNYTYFPDANQKPAEENQDYKKFFLGFGLGINSPSGIIGPNFEFFVANGFTGTLSAGLSTWGYKATLTGKYYLKYPRKSAFGFGISHASGANGLTSDIEYTGSNGNKITEEITLRLRPCQAVNLSWLRYWKLGKYSRIHLELGYSVSVQGKSGRMVELTSVETDLRLIAEFNENIRPGFAILQPGGLIIGSGLTFGL